MILILGVLFFMFFSYYLACLYSFDSKKSFFFVFFFVLSSFFVRLLVLPSLNNDYLLYYNFQIFHKPNSIFSFLLNEPYLYLVYVFFDFFLDSKENVFLGMYWFNYLISTIFFTWLVKRIDVEAWKKMVLFVCYYFIITFVVLRNGPAYILFALYFYYSFRNEKFNWIFLTPFMHISSCLLLVVSFYKCKNYYSILTFVFLSIILIFLFGNTLLSHIEFFKSILNKIDIYSKGIVYTGIMHKIFFTFIVFLIFIGFLVYKKKMLHPILMTTFFIYIISYCINPVVAFRFSPYVILALMLYPFDSVLEKKHLRIVNLVTILFFPIFVYTISNTHQTLKIMELFHYN